MVRRAKTPDGISFDRGGELPDLGPPPPKRTFAPMHDHSRKETRFAADPKKPIQKQISVFVPAPDHSLLRAESIETGKSLTELCRLALAPLLEQLREKAKAKKAG